MSESIRVAPLVGFVWWLRWSLREFGGLNFCLRMPMWAFRRRILRADSIIRLPNDKLLDLPRTSDAALGVFLSNCNIDWGSDSLLLQFLEREQSFIDVGANIGYYSLLASDLVEHVYAFEPDPRSIPVLTRNASRAPNISIIPKALGAHAGTAAFNQDPHTTLSHLLPPGGDQQGTINVECTTLDAFANEAPQLRVTAIKIDVEGFDLDVLLGGRNLIDRDQPLILTEYLVCPGRTNALDPLLTFVRALDYRIFAYVYPSQRPGERFQLTELSALDTVAFPSFMGNVMMGGSDNGAKRFFMMLFLVPQRFYLKFSSLAHNQVEAGSNRR